MADLTSKQVAERLGVKRITVSKWCRNGHLPNAYQQETPRGPIWLIPEEDLQGFAPPPMGRPKKAEEQSPEAESISSAQPKRRKKSLL